MKQRDYDQAFNIFGNTLCQDPENPKALLTLAAEMQVDSFSTLGQVNFSFSQIIKSFYLQRNCGYDEALAKYTKAVTDLSECSETWNNIGMCFFGKHKYVAVNKIIFS